MSTLGLTQQNVTIVKPASSARQAGILPAPSSAQSSRSSNAPKTAKAALPRLKVVVRRLPPGLSETEFWSFLGDEWKAGGPKADWTSYVPGKISKDPAKPSRPSRAYIHLLKAELLPLLSEKVRDTTFQDAKSSSDDPCLLGPPSAEFAPCDRIPNNKPRKDARQGTIDQDEEFINFLHDLTNPTPKPGPVELGSAKEKKPGEPVVTPLIQYLRDKKANKGKEASTTKASKPGRAESKESRGSQSSEKKATGKGAKESIVDRKPPSSSVKGEKSARETAREVVKVLNKQAANLKPKEASKTASPITTNPSVSTTSENAATSAPKPERKRERGSASAAAKILQRDLGLAGSSSGRRRRERDTPSTATPSKAALPLAEVKAADAAVATTSTTPTAAPPKSAEKEAAQRTSASGSATGPATGIVKDTKASAGPASSRGGKAKAQASNTQQTKQKAAAEPTTVSQAAAGRTNAEEAATTHTSAQAFLKHANISQGITEALLQETFSAFGSVSNVSHDKKKGFAYLTFTEPASLQKAIAASPIKVAQGQVAVQERRGGGRGASLHDKSSKASGSGVSSTSGSGQKGGGGGGHRAAGAGGSKGLAEGGNSAASGEAARSGADVQTTSGRRTRGRGRGNKAHMDSPGLKQAVAPVAASGTSPAAKAVASAAAPASSSTAGTTSTGTSVAAAAAAGAPKETSATTTPPTSHQLSP